ncbi:MAG: caspase family protein [Acidiferrobacterales bacterium]|nr:caspase family protein [Acidiferrobacterales bacterium]
MLATLFVLALPGASARGANDLTQLAQAVTTQPGKVGVVPWRSQRFGTYEALLIGINSYSHLPKTEQLTTAINDANAVAQLLLERYGFNVKVLRNARRETIFAELARLRAELTETDHLLLYYAGHGHIDGQNKRGYWWPSDADPNDSATWIANAEVTDQVKAMKATHVLIVADSCYTGTQPYGSLASPAGEKRDVWLQHLAKIRARTVLTSGSLQPLTKTSASEHSIFANAFMQALRVNDHVTEGARLLATLGSPATYAFIDGNSDRDGDFLFVPRNR